MKIHKIGGEGSAPKAAGFLHVGASWTPLVLKKNREKIGGLLETAKKPVRIKKTAWWGGGTAKTPMG